jgi:hypothetical protein
MPVLTRVCEVQLVGIGNGHGLRRAIWYRLRADAKQRLHTDGQVGTFELKSCVSLRRLPGCIITSVHIAAQTRSDATPRGRIVAGECEAKFVIFSPSQPIPASSEATYVITVMSMKIDNPFEVPLDASVSTAASAPARAPVTASPYLDNGGGLQAAITKAAVQHILNVQPQEQQPQNQQPGFVDLTAKHGCVQIVSAALHIQQRCQET